MWELRRTRLLPLSVLSFTRDILLQDLHSYAEPAIAIKSNAAGWIRRSIVLVRQHFKTFPCFARENLLCYQLLATVHVLCLLGPLITCLPTYTVLSTWWRQSEMTVVAKIYWGCLSSDNGSAYGFKFLMTEKPVEYILCWVTNMSE